jgi:hypothetical protein
MMSPDGNPLIGNMITVLAQRNFGQQMDSVFWDVEGILLIERLLQVQIINREVSCNTLMSIHCRIQQQCPCKSAFQIPSLYDNARPQH